MAAPSIKSLQTQVASLTTQLTTCKAQLAAANAKVSALTGQLAVCQASLATVQQQLTAAQAEIVTLKARIAELEAEPTPEPPPPVHAGWMVFTASADTRTVYVSNSAGNDANGGLTPETAVKTIKRALALIRNGYPDWLLFKKGDVWTDETFGYMSGGYAKSGRSATEPMLFSFYGSGARPQFKTNPLMGEVAIGATYNGSNFLAIVGLEFYAYTRDPNSPAYNAATITNAHFGYRLAGGPVDWLLIEDCKFSFYSTNVIIGSGSATSNISVRRNVVTDAYSTNSHSQGIYIDRALNLLLEENVFDHNGWNEQISGAGKTMFNHNIYIQGIRVPGDLTTINGPVIARGNISANASSQGAQFRSGGTITDNLFVQNPIGHNIGMPSAFASTIRNNVHTGTIETGWGFEVFSAYSGDAYNVGTVTVSNNILAHSQAATGWGIYLSAGTKGNTVTQNVVYDWRAPLISDNGTGNIVSDNKTDGLGFSDPSRSVESYMLSLGQTGTIDAFLAEARKQSRDTWRPAYTAEAVNAYIRAGFTPA